MSATKRFAGKVAIVTGASAGMGQAVAEQLAEEGAKVVLAARTKEKLDSVVKDITSKGGEAIAVAVDVSTETGNKQLVDTALNKYGQLNIAFLNAGMAVRQTLLEITEESFDTMYGLNVKGVVFGLKYALPAIEKSGGSGSIIINSSCTGSFAKASATSGIAVYASTKAAVDMIMKYAAVEAAAHKTRVNCVAPGIVRTNFRGDSATDEDYEEAARPTHLVERAGKPEEISSVVCFLASDEASFVTGSVMLADGGWALKA